MPGSIIQHTHLYYAAWQYEVEMRKALDGDPKKWEAVNFYNKLNNPVPGDVVAVHEGNPMRFDIETSAPGLKSDEALLYKFVNRNRVERQREFFACNSDWMEYAARITGFETTEVKIMIVTYDETSLLFR